MNLINPITYNSILDKNIINPDRQRYYYLEKINILRRNSFTSETKFNLVQSGGYLYKYADNSYEYTIELYEPDLQTHAKTNQNQRKIIYIYNKNPDIRSQYCSSLSYINSDYLFIDVIETPIRCINVSEINPDSSIKSGHFSQADIY
jgi:hypothetical protein